MVNAFQRALPRWYHRHRRALPWRRTRDPYKIWVSEIMLQQTRVEVVMPYYRRWLRAFPTVHALARAPYSRVLKQWEGLGYYSRARNLHAAARLIARTGQEWRSHQQLWALPGIGRYTAAAIASIAFGEPVPVVDGNVARVFARVFCRRENVKLPRTLDRFFSLAHTLMPATAPGDYNQALMELGALVCTPLNPRCAACPLRRVCQAHARGEVARFPNRGPRPPPQAATESVAWVRRADTVLVRRRPRTGLLAGMWELPGLDRTVFRPGRELCVIRHTITNRRVTLRVRACVLRRPAVGCRWVNRRNLRRLTVPAAHRKALAVIPF